MSETMVERVAKALQQAHYHRGRGIAPSWDTLDEFERHMWIYSARTAIAAMREPTEAMSASGGFYCIQDAGPMKPVDKAQARTVWKAMIDTALTEGQSDE